MILSYPDFLREKKNPCWNGYTQIGTKKRRSKKFLTASMLTRDWRNLIEQNSIWITTAIFHLLNSKSINTETLSLFQFPREILSKTYRNE